MRHLAAGRHSGSEAQGGEHLVRVIVLDDAPDGFDGCRVLVVPEVGVSEVERPRIKGVAVRGCEVDCHGQDVPRPFAFQSR